jgi:hypothetical protein
MLTAIGRKIDGDAPLFEMHGDGKYGLQNNNIVSRELERIRQPPRIKQAIRELTEALSVQSGRSYDDPSSQPIAAIENHPQATQTSINGEVPKAGHSPDRKAAEQKANARISELPADIGFDEGALKRRLVNEYKRNKKNRIRCLEFYKPRTCFICGFSFEEHYGADGKELIEVHHEIPLAKQGGSHKVNPKKDMKPVCSNCHFVIHSVEPCKTIEEMCRIWDSLHPDNPRTRPK